jgi:stalled ribosome rescue protein Dom34
MVQLHAAVWLDHNEARIFHVTAESFDATTIVSPKAHTQLHRRSGPGAESGHRAQGDAHFYADIEKALAGAKAILVLGPSTAKLELIKHVHKHARDLEPRIVGIETVDHPSDGQLVRYVRRYFDIPDRVMTAPPPQPQP